jgi:hypothetical protein
MKCLGALPVRLRGHKLTFLLRLRHGRQPVRLRTMLVFRWRAGAGAYMDILAASFSPMQVKGVLVRLFPTNCVTVGAVSPPYGQGGPTPFLLAGKENLRESTKGDPYPQL